MATETNPASELAAKAKAWHDFVTIYPDAAQASFEAFVEWARKRNIQSDFAMLWESKQASDTLFAQTLPEHPTAPTQERARLFNLENIASLAVLPFLFKRPELMEDDHDFQEIEKNLKKKWLKEHGVKDFQSKEGIDYLYGSLEDENAASLSKDAEKQFREKHAKKAEKYDKKKLKTYRNPEADPAVIRLRERVDEHAEARHALLKKTDPNVSLDTLREQIEKKEWERFALQYRDKAVAYVQKQEKNAEKYPHLKNALVKAHLKDYQATSEGKQEVKFVEEKLHRDQSITPGQAAERVKEAAAQAATPPSPSAQQPIQPPPSTGIRERVAYPTKEEKERKESLQQPPSKEQVERYQRYMDRISQYFKRLRPLPMQRPPVGSRPGFLTRGMNAINGFRNPLGILQRPGSLFGNFGGRAAQFGGTLIRQGAMAAGRVVAMHPVTWIVIGAIILLLLIVFLIVLLFGSSSGSGDQTVNIHGLTIQKTGPKGCTTDCQVGNGEDIIYTINVNYTGTQDVTIIDTLPNDTRYVNASGIHNIAGNTVSWPLKYNEPTSPGSYTFTLTVNPLVRDFIAVNRVSAQATGGTTPGVSGPVPTGGSGNACTQKWEGTGYCAVSYLKNFFGGDVGKAITASLVCQEESRSNPFAMNTNCRTNDYSVGLFQINLIAHCPGAFSGNFCNRRIVDQAKLSACEAQFKDPDQNIQKAVQLSQNGTRWTPWGVWPSVQNKLRSCGI